MGDPPGTGGGGATDTIQKLSTLFVSLNTAFVNHGIALCGKCIGNNLFLYWSLRLVSICVGGMTS